MTAQTKQYCLRGHDTSVVGRNAQRMCRACLRAWDRARNQRRREDPAYVAAEGRYSSAWYHRRGAFLRSGRRWASRHEQVANLGPALSEHNGTPFGQWIAAQIAAMTATVTEAQADRAWNGDPHHVYAPPGQYRSRPDAPRVTREAVEAIAEAQPWLRHRRRSAA